MPAVSHCQQSKTMYHLIAHARFEIFMAVTTKNAIFWDVTPCDSCKNWCFRGLYNLHHQGGKNQWTRNNISSNYLQKVSSYKSPVWLDIDLWFWLYMGTNKQTNSVALSPRANYTWVQQVEIRWPQHAVFRF
jgi:hypothetical protein